MHRFRDRVDAGMQLASRLQRFVDRDVIVLGLPRGGVPVAAQVAKVLGAPLDVLVVRKLGVPFQPELAMGAIGEDDVVVTDRGVVQQADVTPSEWSEVLGRERDELAKRIREYRGDRSPTALEGRIVVIVDDGIATGSTARAACLVARARGAREVVLAAPVAAADAIDWLRDVADDVICVDTPSWFRGVGQWYEDFSPTSGDEVVACLEAARARGRDA